MCLSVCFGFARQHGSKDTKQTLKGDEYDYSNWLNVLCNMGRCRVHDGLLQITLEIVQTSLTFGTKNLTEPHVRVYTVVFT